MAVDSIHRVQAYTVTQSSETNDEERRREKQGKTSEASKKRRGNKTSNKENEIQVKTEALSQIDLTISSQLVNSEKVIELLSHRHKTSLNKNPMPFKTVKKMEQNKTAISSVKKLNRIL